ncbi:MAG: hypothetical protein HYR66_09060 [Sphingobacteriales bacterium]|nr:hypothetical protein [Sphingobacteriales bacterium]MBI3720329.1 hypothetical protein [Sphingobacteriales bacterium]
MNIAVKITLILALALTMNGNGMAEGNKTMSGIKNEEKMKTAITSGQSNKSSTEETDDHYLFPLSNAILNRL